MSTAGRKPKVLVPTVMAQAGRDILARRQDIETIAYDMNMPVAAFHALLADADAVSVSLNPFGAAEVAAAPRVRAVARHGVGYDSVDVPALTRRGVPLMVTGIANSPTVAEHALYFMLALAKRGAELHALVQSNRWATARVAKDLPADLFGKTLLVVGFGRIGTRLAPPCRALGMTVRVYDPYVDAAAISAAGCIPEPDLDAALPHADFVSIHCPRSRETDGMFDDARFARMKPTAYLVNTARGGIVDEAALHRALTKGTIRAAALDVLDREPPAADHPLFGLPNLLTSPHMAGVTRESIDRMAIAVAENLLSAIDGRPNVDNVINKEVLQHR
jgi:D-3-phosphoglycerate dehydrogenase